MKENEAMEKLSAVKDATHDYNLKCAISEAFDWRGSALYYQSQVREYTKELETLHKRINTLTKELKQVQAELSLCDCDECFSREL